LTRRNLIALLLSIALFAIATNIRSGWVYLFSSILLASVLLGVLSAVMNVQRVALDLRFPSKAFETEPFKVDLTVRNNGRFCARMVTIREQPYFPDSAFLQTAGPIRGSIRWLGNYWKFLKEGFGAARDWRRGITDNPPVLALEAIAAGKTLEISYESSYPLRGYYPFAVMRVSSASITGNAGYTRKIIIPTGIIVFPSVYKISWFPFESADPFASAEYHEWTRKGIGQDYFGVREYARGDSLRHIHWRLSAKHNTLIVKEYQQEFKPSAGLIISLRAPNSGTRHKNTLEDGLRAASSIANFYAEMGCLPKMIFARDGGSDVLVPEHVEDCFEALALFEPDEKANATHGRRMSDILFDAIDFGRRVHFSGSSITVITNMPAGEFEDFLKSIPSAENLTFVLILEESYGDGLTPEEESSLIEKLKILAASRFSNLYVVRKDRGVADCLNEPLHITAA